MAQQETVGVCVCGYDEVTMYPVYIFILLAIFQLFIFFLTIWASIFVKPSRFDVPEAKLFDILDSAVRRSMPIMLCEMMLDHSIKTKLKQNAIHDGIEWKENKSK